jgi:two-component system cell cycle response regulator
MSNPDWEEETSITAIGEVLPSTHTERDRAYLIVLAGGNVGEMYKILAGDAVIGRGRNVDVVLIDDGVSREHARIRIDGGHLFLEDLGSRNGTFRNGMKVDTPVQLNDGDKIQVGRTTILKFTYNDHLDESFQQQMYDSALRDGLTKAFNKRYFSDRLEGEFRFAQRHGTPLSLMMLDLDHFKKINDEHGHLAGDYALQGFAEVVQNSVRTEDVFARYGGEEFAIISRAITSEAAKRFAERLRRVVESLAIPIGTTSVRVTVSIGIAGIPELALEGPADLLRCADKALYIAKHRGRNRVEVFEPDHEDTKET